MKNYIGLSRDHSGSMRSIARAAAKDYNDSIATIKSASDANGQDTIVSVVKCGHGRNPIVHREIVNSHITSLQPIPVYEYQADATGTPLFDSVMELIRIFQNVPDIDDDSVSFLVMVTTDGAENCSVTTGRQLAVKIADLQATDRWTFVFRVPRGHSKELVRLGIPSGNILEWDQTEKGVAVAQEANREAFTQYFTARSAGAKSTGKFYANLSDVSVKDVQAVLTDISSQVQELTVPMRCDGQQIRDFVERVHLGGNAMEKGAAFYQLVKTEPKVQANKRIIIRDKTSGAAYTGDAARQMLALPSYGTVRLAPDELGNFEVFIQSTSVNRKVNGGSRLLYWSAVGKAFKEGPSAR